jgi:hypothetical protein
MVRGGCNCGAVTFRLSGQLRPVIACHCVECRKASGHFWAATAVPLDKLVFDTKTGLAWYRSSARARRGFCDTCGAALFYAPDGEDRIAVAAGALDKGSGLTLQSHVFTAEQGDYYDRPDDLPHFAGFSGREAG